MGEVGEVGGAMPELPEVESVRRALAPIVGRKVLAVEVRRRDVITEVAGADSNLERALLAGESIRALHRHGKQLAIESRSGAVVRVQLGMSGQVLLGETFAAKSHRHVVWTLASGLTMTFRDPRRFGGLTVAGSLADLAREHWESLGPDALLITPDELAAGLRGSARAIKAALLDQSVLAGVGNIYADEALFESGIRPSTPASKLKPAQVARLTDAIHQVLQQAIEAGGSTLRDYVRPDGLPGEAAVAHKVYGRGGQACVVCGGELRRVTLAQRTTVYCPTCQR